MKKYWFLILISSTFLFSSCKTQSTGCNRCPNQAYIEDKILFPDNQHNLFVSAEKSFFTPSTLPDLPKTFSELMGKEEISPLTADIIKKAFQYEGVRYRRGGLSEKGLDCSGLIYKTFSSFGISLPRTSIDMSRTVDEISREEAKKGDLVFFKTNGRKRINHVGMIIEVNDDEIKFIHASVKYGVTVSSIKENYYAKTLAKIGRVLDI